mmetsp:Transcript_8305/g.15988  ORF Transcript_8305/g.15988 Transcript_8305/m.15988 type:complete len:389 (-) Transcript_8305:681-1847(-)|eukprot:CAMPEP_0175058534 /NCGR_PEP_ID=MMETSP0052_2-20121109/11900_1 /TAXON_ID=51329 ORGANISM="Polytomella parva, Strain SAG 63-3" /NCGR_SAMPLE_ID=MMETSP0052_2 /ASSEMBLY_ACC=CAM_ASM_000194 /LENGTH=388 /DNA_ID=CAMNT_0016323923 /DNA_START=147 /DNA_END=1313 /DNA_ORIENTATION=+
MAQQAIATSRKAVRTFFWQSDKPALKGHLLLLAVSVAPLLGFIIPTSVNVIVQASLAVFCGSWRSVKPVDEGPGETMTKKDAMRFPLIGSVVLFSLFLLFKFLPPYLVNGLLSLYLGLVAIFVLTSAIYPFVSDFFPEWMKESTISLPNIKLPFLTTKEPDTAANEESPTLPTIAEITLSVFSFSFCVWYYVKKHWFANNMLGLSFCLEGIEFLNVGSVQTATILLLGLFFYDVFWVFCTPVMVSVAKNFDAPIKLLFPRPDLIDGRRGFSMLGLGDIVIPGIVVALFLRYDIHKNFRTKYFQSAFGGYVLGLTATIVVMNKFQAAQPALLYIVPSVLGCVFLHAKIKGEFKAIFAHSEEVEKVTEGADKVEGSQSQPVIEPEAKKDK